MRKVTIAAALALVAALAVAGCKVEPAGSPIGPDGSSNPGSSNSDTSGATP